MVFNGELTKPVGLLKRKIETVLESPQQLCKDIWNPKKRASYLSKNKNGQDLRENPIVQLVKT